MRLRTKAALGVYDAVILAFPDTALAHYGRGVVLRKLQRPEEAFEAMDKVKTRFVYHAHHIMPHPNLKHKY